ncbi:hypothetical protein DCAR_0104868 [Daucus carota subsp. sativus]|uniref:Uncharacterized protein n=1 Tax=Daucus carota subsp. sativus TaxID=79200 RepID=A0A162BA29_DAUCS|nr:hypothetical protein DCAR_0104868 [Daucus carota subsp. sativus]
MVSSKGTHDEGPYNPEIRISCDDELYFLHSPGPHDTSHGCSFSRKSEGEPLSARMRAVARFLKDRSSFTPVIERD